MPILMPNSIPNLYGLSYETMEQWMDKLGHKPGVSDRLFGLLYRQHLNNLDQIPDKIIPQTLIRSLLNNPAKIYSFTQSENLVSKDGSIKYLFTLKDGHKIESVYMPFEKRITICLSSQVGCAMGCTFCATGSMGLVRQLTVDEIIGQLMGILREHPLSKGFRQRLNVVFMGMGEPLHNLDNIMKAFDILTHQRGLAIPPRAITISTSGLVPKIKQLAQFPIRPRLIVSIGATTNEKRSEIMPINISYPLEILMETLAQYPLAKDDRITLSYVLISNINDSYDDAIRLASMADQFHSHINIIPLNAHDQSPELKTPSEEKLNAFYKVLADKGIFTTIRRSRGQDTSAACGQLVNNHLSK